MNSRGYTKNIDEEFINIEDIDIKENILQSNQSPNSFFHFMRNIEYLEEILENKRFYPRYCEEDISMLGFRNQEYLNSNEMFL